MPLIGDESILGIQDWRPHRMGDLGVRGQCENKGTFIMEVKGKTRFFDSYLAKTPRPRI